RYAFLMDAAEGVGAGAIAVGHQADDQVETVLHRLLRGAGLRGLAGMRLSRPVAEGVSVRLVRPLLRTWRRQVLAHLEERGLRYREDASNVDRGFVRNRIRHELLPLLGSEYNPSIGEAVVRLSRAAAHAQDFLAASAASADCVSGAEVSLDGFRELHDAVKPLVIDRALAALGRMPQLDAVHYESLIRAAESGEPGGQVDLPGDVRAVRGRDRLAFSAGPAGAPAPEIEEPLPVPGRADLPELGRTVEAELVDRSALDLDAFLSEKTRYHEAVDYDRLSGRLVVRSRRDGDRFRPLGATGTKTVGEFLTDAKVPPDERARVLVVVSGEQPVWVVGHRIDDRVKVRDDTARALLLTVREIRRESNGTKED
ncbi:MAG: tRNA lysidine(34) synthetase TilS, partial [bacterium]